MLNKEEKQMLKAYRKLKEYGAKNIALVDTDKYDIQGLKGDNVWKYQRYLEE